MKITIKKCMETDRYIQILLSTYNGEKYLREQLDSYIALEGFERVKVLIRDDGSTDGTRDILEEYRARYGFTVLYGKNIGICESFKTLFGSCDLSCGYFAISDQDDVWYSNKFALAMQHLEPVSPDSPAVFASRSEIVAEDLAPLGETIKLRYGCSFFNAMVQNVLPGHTQVLTRGLMRILQSSDFSNVLVIDWWIYMIASALGQVMVSDDATVLHRQHGGNAVGYEVNRFQNFCGRIKRLLAGRSGKITLQIESFYNQYARLIPKDAADEAVKFMDSQKTVWRRLRYVFSCRIYRQTAFETFVLKLLYILGNYKIWGRE